MNYKVNDPNTDVDGTCLQGYIDIKHSELVEKLGESSSDFDSYKSDGEWTIEFEDGTVATIYNYKDGKNYNGAQGLETEDITNWHIGGKDKTAVEYIRKLFGK